MLTACTVWIVAVPLSASGQIPKHVTVGSSFAPGREELFVVDFDRMPVGSFPSVGIRRLSGTMSVVMKDGRRMLKATDHSQFLITLPNDRRLPQRFTVELDVVPKESGPQPDLTIEGTRSINQGDASAHLQFLGDASFGVFYVVGGEPTEPELPIPDEIRATLPETLTKVGLSVEGNTIRFFVNGVEILPETTEPARKLRARFARGNVLRVTLGGVTDGDEIRPVYLARVRLATDAPAMTPAAHPVSDPETSGTQIGTPPLPASVTRTIALSGFAAAGVSGTTASKTFTLPAFTATGTGSSSTSRIIRLAGFTGAGVSVTTAPRAFVLSGFTGTGVSVIAVPRTIVLSGFTGSGEAVLHLPRTIRLAGWTAAGEVKPPQEP